MSVKSTVGKNQHPAVFAVHCHTVGAGQKARRVVLPDVKCRVAVERDIEAPRTQPLKRHRNTGLRAGKPLGILCHLDKHADLLLICAAVVKWVRVREARDLKWRGLLGMRGLSVTL